MRHMLDRLSERNKSWLVLGASVLALLVLAAWRPLALPDEGRYGEIGRWMLVSGDWMTPRLNGIPFFHKPPLLHWLDAAAFAVLGVSPWVARLVPALHAALMLVVLYVGARRVVPEGTARLAAAMLGSGLGFLLGGQYVNHDMVVACWISVAIWCFALALGHGQKPHPGWARMGFVACGLGVMSKMLIGLLLPGLVLVVWIAWTRQWRKLLYLPWFSGLLLFALITVPWFVLEQARYPGMFDYLFIGQQFGRYTGSTFNNSQAWWFYLPTLLLLLFPWAFFALALGWLSRPGRNPSTPADATSQWQALCWIWLVAITVFFSIPRSKIVGYVLPVLPPLALLAAWGWERTVGHRLWAGKAFAALLTLAVGIAVLANVAATRVTLARSSEDVARVLSCLATPQDTVYASGDFPYDLPFYAQTVRPMVVVQDWPTLRRSAGDNWRRELFEGADFEPAAATVLQTPEVLGIAAGQGGNWLVTARETKGGDAVPPVGWVPIQQGKAWTLYRSAPERPVTAQAIGLGGCENHRQK